MVETSNIERRTPNIEWKRGMAWRLRRTCRSRLVSRPNRRTATSALHGKRMVRLVSNLLPTLGCRGLGRSEERRVGKECRWTGDWSSDVCSSDLTKWWKHRTSNAERRTSNGRGGWRGDSDEHAGAGW